VRWTGIALAAIAAGVVGIAGWQIWEAKQLEIPKWMDTDRADCRTWDPYPQRGETVSWSGECQSGKAEGAGTLTWHYTDPAGNPLVETSAGKLTAGKWNGQVTMAMPNDNRFDGMYRDGAKNGHGVYIWSDGRYDGAWKDDKPDGLGTFTDADGKPHTGEWKQGCFADEDGTIALKNDLETCEKILTK
jgi:hypothetical protein